MELFKHQQEALEQTKDLNRVAYYMDMGLGKTFVGAEKLHSLKTTYNLVVCQKSKIKDWVEHFSTYYSDMLVWDLTKKLQLELFNLYAEDIPCVGVINYELLWRKKEFSNLKDFTLMLDESSLIQNSKAKRTKFILKLNAKNVILLSGTPTAGKYENLWSQAKLLGWDIKEKVYQAQYVNYKLLEIGGGVNVWVVDKEQPYKNVERLKRKFRQHGAIFMQTEEVIDLPAQNWIDVPVDKPKEYNKFMKNGYILLKNGFELVATTSLTKRLYARQLASQYNNSKLDALEDLIDSTNDRLIIFYNFNAELEQLKGICERHSRSVSVVNGTCKDLQAYEENNGSITLVQYQAGAMGLNLQKANKLIYFSLCERSDLFEQSKKRIHRIGTKKPCFYYVLLAKGTVDYGIYAALKQRKDYTDELFKGGEGL